MEDFTILQDAIYDKIQQARQSKGQIELFPYEDLGPREDFVAKRSASIDFSLPENKVDDFNDFVASELQSKLDSDNHEPAISLSLERAATHFGVFVKKNDQTITVQVTVFYYYLDIDPLGPVIDGDIVVQGVIADDRYLPCMCTLEVDNDGDFMEVVTVPPTRMMINTGNEGDDMDNVGKIMIPLTVPDEQIDKLFRVRVYVKEKLAVSLEEDVPDFDSPENRKDMILAIESTPNAANSISVEGLEGLLDMNPENLDKARDGGAEDEEDGDFNRPDMTEEEKEIAEMEEKLLQSGQVLEDDEDFGQNVTDGDNNSTDPASQLPVLHEIHIAFDYDELIALQSEGYQLICTHVTPDGPVSDQEQLWKYHVLGKYGSANEPGIEDIVFVKCLKSMGTLPVVPFYKIMHDYDLADPEDSYAVYIAVKMGPGPKFQQMVMLSANYEDEDLLQKHVNSVGAIYRPSPEEVERVFRGRCGLMFIAAASNGAKSKKHAKAAAVTTATLDATDPVQTGSRAGDGDNSSNNQRGDDEDDEEDDEDEDEEGDDDEEMIATLRVQIERVENEKLSLVSMNADLQKRAVLLMQREKALQGQATGGATAARAADSAATPAAGGAANAAGASGAGGVGEGELNYEQTLEKEKQYQDVLRVIVEARNKLEKQLRDFEQLAVDLQTRLDDKEFNAKSIATSFKQFKKEILSKSENSRTGHHIAKQQIEAIEGAELKREEDLEKVRLRNIGLRNLQKKLENTLRAREKLADDLHYIDFEQLKIENQTLNEKIEERNEELAKLKRKKTTTVQVLTHIREKLRFTENSNRVLREKVNSIDQVITKLRNIVTSYKLERDSIRLENKELRAKQGFATSDLLLMDYENQKHQSDVLIAEITELKNRYEILNRQAKLGMSMSGSNAFDPAGGSSTSGGKLGNKWTTSG